MNIVPIAKTLHIICKTTVQSPVLTLLRKSFCKVMVNMKVMENKINQGNRQHRILSIVDLFSSKKKNNPFFKKSIFETSILFGKFNISLRNHLYIITHVGMCVSLIIGLLTLFSKINCSLYMNLILLDEIVLSIKNVT
jgi:hypothetical protein